MTVDEISARLRARLQEEYGVDEAAILMDRPPGGWGDLVTNQSLDRRLETINHGFETLEYKLSAKLEAEIRAQTWRLMTATVAAMSGLVAAMGIFVAIVNSR